MPPWLRRLSEKLFIDRPRKGSSTDQIDAQIKNAPTEVQEGFQRIGLPQEAQSPADMAALLKTYGDLAQLGDALILARLIVRVKDDEQRSRIARGVRTIQQLGNDYSDVLKISCLIEETYPIFEEIGTTSPPELEFVKLLTLLLQTVMQHKDRVIAEQQEVSNQLETLLRDSQSK